MIRRTIATAAALLALSACAHVPMQQGVTQTALSEAPAARGSFVSMAKGPFTADPVSGQWWKLYDDPRLDALIEEALKANADLRVAAANIDHAEALARQAMAQGGLQTTSSAGAAVSRSGSTLADMPVLLGTSLGLSISYDLDLGGRIRSLIAAADHDAEAARAAYDLTRVNVAAGVAGAFADACSAAWQRQAAQHSLDLLRRNLEYTDRLVAAGRATPLDQDNAQVLIAQLEAQMPAYDAAQENALFRLATLLGRPPAEFPQDVRQCAMPPRVLRPMPVGDGAALLRRRPDVREAERAVAAAAARIGVATADLYPTVRFGASAADASPLSQFGAGRGFSFSFGPLLSWTFPNRRIARATIDAAEASHTATLARFDGVMLTALRETESALTSYAYELKRNAALRVARDKAASAQARVHRLRVAGRESTLAELVAARTLAATETTLASSDAALASDQVAVFLALGGGWQGDG